MSGLFFEIHPLLSTTEFYHELIGINFNEMGARTRIFKVDLDPLAFLGALSTSKELALISSSDGAISHVRENPAAASTDNSASSRYFSLHTDGKYLPVVPEMAILHCVNPGTSEIPTVFVDTKDIIDALAVIDRLDEAAEYEHVFRNREGVDFIRPLIELHPASREPVMNIAIASPQCHLRPRADSSQTKAEADEFYGLLEKIVEEDIAVMPHVWEKNDAVVFDNLRLIHGRGLPEHKALETPDFQRHLHRIWLSRRQLQPTATAPIALS